MNLKCVIALNEQVNLCSHEMEQEVFNKAYRCFIEMEKEVYEA